MNTKFPLTIYYDGSCIVCATEIDHYRRLQHQGRLQFVDITAPDFDAAIYGRTQGAFMARMHVKDAVGNFHVGVDAFLEIWSALPNRGYRLLGKAIALPGIHCAARCGYALFARYRRYLPKRTRCQGDNCALH
ncbi:MAG: DUF393 domain-containing protein [Desulfuromonadales bacterium]|nr:DUF393 domain-containing protein [Desulfuromonadales bacterium]